MLFFLFHFLSFFFWKEKKLDVNFLADLLFFSMFLFESFENLNSIFLKPAKELNVY